MSKEQPEKQGKSSLLWIHCNKCFELYVKKQKRIYLLSCSHILCESCIHNEKQKNFCSYCQKNVNYKLINNNMPSQYKKLFNPQPWQDLSSINDVMPFQMKHRDHFAKGIKKIKERIKIEQKQINNMKEELIGIERMRKRKQQEALLLEEKLKKLKYEYQVNAFNINSTV